MEWLYLINFVCVIFSGWVALGCFQRGSTGLGYLNLFASALNAALIVARFF